MAATCVEAELSPNATVRQADVTAPIPIETPPPAVLGAGAFAPLPIAMVFVELAVVAWPITIEFPPVADAADPIAIA